MAQGQDPEPLVTLVNAPKTIGHGKVLPPGTRDLRTLLIYLQHMAEKIGARLRLHNLHSSHFFISLKTEQDWLATKVKSDYATDDGRGIYEMGRDFMAKH